ncbi:nectin-4-like isoform X6 [Alosa sapidissima]|uniref:nectin-4-like isoform X6 n=1 Tax=Alosa sapidissima TaxID=34773 RepID=UPI001C08DB36|nr:nectin-4-like isoform X6 [Alosa sapidissima]
MDLGFWLCLLVVVRTSTGAYEGDGVGVQEGSNVIHYPPQSVKITQMDDGYQCSADANPKPDYTWAREGHPLPSGVRAEGNRLYLDFIPELNGLYTCKASNSYGTAEGHHTLYAVTGASGRPLSVIIIISVIFGAILIIMLRKCIISRNQQETLKVVAKKLLQ